MENIVSIMKSLGFTTYEAKAYLCLLKNNPATCYELSKLSGVPRSAIYGVIRKLETQGIVNAICTKPKRYIPLSPDQLFKLLDNRFKSSVEVLKENLEKLDTTVEMDHLWNIAGYDNMILKAKEMIKSARKNIYLSVWRREALLLQKELEEAEKRGVKIVIFSFTEIPFKVGRVLSHGLEEEKLERIWNHRIILCVDQEELLMGDADTSSHKKTAWTRNKAIISIALNTITLDITLFGQRYEVNIDDCLIEMQPGELEYLGKLLAEKHPENHFKKIPG